MESTLAKVGNSAAVIIPSPLRRKASMSVGDELSIESPRTGVIVITAVHDEGIDRLGRLEEAERRLADLARELPPWPEGQNAEDLIRSGKKERVGEIALL